MASNRSHQGKEEVRISFKFVRKDFDHRFFFNRFAVVTLPDHYVLDFAYVLETGAIAQIFSAVLLKEDRERSRASLEDYLTRVGAPQNPAVPWSAPSQQRNFQIVNQFEMAQTGAFGEILMYSLVVKDLVDRIKKAKVDEIQCHSVACLSCLVETQKQFLAELYVDNS